MKSTLAFQRGFELQQFRLRTNSRPRLKQQIARDSHRAPQHTTELDYNKTDGVQCRSGQLRSRMRAGS
eukprot:5183839-Pleurochrysis_carterae.AAC.1